MAKRNGRGRSSCQPTGDACNFCGRTDAAAGPYVTGNQPGRSRICYICAQDIYNDVRELRNQFDICQCEPEQPEIKKSAVPSPKEIVDFLDTHVVGQSGSKRKLAIAISNHYQRVLYQHNPDRPGMGAKIIEDPELANVTIEKSNVCLIGPTGSGKTHLLQSLAKYLKVPFAIGDATSLTEAGYVGEDVESLLLKLLVAADYDLDAAEHGILYIDEIDKIAKTTPFRSITRDASGEGVQQCLLKLMEGTIANVPPQGGRKHPEQPYIKMDTSNILFIVGGAFTELPGIIADRLGTNSGCDIGFTQKTEQRTQVDEQDLLQYVLPEDLQAFGLIPEFVGRLPVLSTLNELSVDDLVKVLTEPQNALVKQYRKQFQFHGADVQFTPEAVREIATLAYRRGIGARGLRSVMENVMEDLLFDLPGQPEGMQWTVTEFQVTGEEFPF